MKYQLWYREGRGEPMRGYFQWFTERIGVGTYLNLTEVCQHIQNWNSYRAIWEIESVER